ncbi:hypothetical protein PVAP13_8NG173303 [Panicum virgatum]|uniref:Uncharacterized protein n=1 Tax=Panicum virgatum TaxID=38727 RepID=A0A8T0P3X4_PANVG|nr:hypothetical protein PVAP13_8NG173303 [Panicum virgatum]
MSNGQQGDVPGGYFVGRPTNHAPDRTDEPAAGGSGGGGEHTPGDYFVGRPENHRKLEQEPAPKPATKQSTPGFLAKCCPCLGAGAAD